MRILVFLERADVRGGIEVFAERQVESLRAKGDSVDVVHELPPSFDGYGEIIVHKCRDVDVLAMFPPERTAYYVHDHEPICPRTYAYTPLGRNCSRASGIWPCAICAPLCRSWKAALGRVFSQGRRKKVMSRFRRIVVISEFMKGRLVANGIPPEIVVVESPEIAVKAPRDGEERSGVDLLFVGQLIRGKGVQLLLEAMARMRKQRTLDVLGAGNMEAKLKALAGKLGVGERVRWHGFADNPQGWMRAAKCVVVPSFWQEPFGLVAAEAVAVGTKVVEFAIGGLPEACGGRATLVPPGDVDALAAALEEA